MTLPASHLGKAARKQDLRELVEYLRDEGILLAKDAKTMADVAKIHAAAHTFLLWSHELRKQPEHSRAYVAEMASDALQLLPHSLAGFGKSTSLLIRSIVEGLFRHIYFTDHPVEHAKANALTWHIKVHELFEYAKTHPEFAQAEKRFDAIGRLSNLYAELSRYVHGGAVATMETRRALREIKFDPQALAAHAKWVTRCAQSANYLMLKFHHERKQGFNTTHHQLMLDLVPMQGRKILAGI